MRTSVRRATGRRVGPALLALATLTATGTACSQQEPDAVVAAATTAPEATPDAAASSTPTLTAATTAPASATTPAPSSAPPLRRLSVSDPAGDLDAARPSHWFAPSADLTRFVAAYEAGSRTMTFRVTFRDLRGLARQRQRFEQSITVANDAGSWTAVHFERSPWHGDSIVIHGATGRPLSKGGGIRVCRGATSATRADTVILSVPVGCIARGQRPAHFSVWTNAQQVFRAGSSQSIASDELLTTRRVLTR